MKKTTIALLFLASLLYASGENTISKEELEKIYEEQKIAMAKPPVIEDMKELKLISQDDINEQNKLSTPIKTQPSQSVEDDFEDFKDKIGFEDYGMISDKGVAFYNSSAIVNVSENDKDFARHLSLAYEKAFLDLLAEIIISSTGRSAVNTAKEIFQDTSSDRNKFPPEEIPGTLSQIGHKIAMLSGAALDTALSKLGVKSKSVKGLKDEQKKELLRDLFARNISEDAFGNVSGVVAVQTFAKTTKNNSVEIGVVAVQSYKTRELAQDLLNSKKPFIRGKNGKNLQEFLPSDLKDFPAQFGTRLVYDEKARPVIISFGNWGYPIDDSSGIILDKRAKYAKKSASMQADANIMAFVNTQIDARSKLDISTDVREFIKRITDVNTNDKKDSKETLTTLKDVLSSHIKASSAGKLKGIKTLKRWEYTDEKERAFVGVVRYWSFENVKNVDKMNQALPTRMEKRAKPGKSPQGNFDQSSKTVNELDDF